MMKAFWDIALCSLIEVNQRFKRAIALMMDAVHTSDTSVYFNEATWCYIPESYHLLGLK
jgi:hypothetical protein